MKVATRRFGSLIPNQFGLASSEMNDLLESMFQVPRKVETNGRGWVPAASVWEDEHLFHVDVELPGFDRDQVEVTFEEGRLLITANRPKPEGDHQFHYNDRSWGGVERAFNLPDTVDTESIEASLDNGLLRISLAKRAEVLPRKIEIKSN